MKLITFKIFVTFLSFITFFYKFCLFFDVFRIYKSNFRDIAYCKAELNNVWIYFFDKKHDFIRKSCYFYLIFIQKNQKWIAQKHHGETLADLQESWNQRKAWILLEEGYVNSTRTPVMRCYWRLLGEEQGICKYKIFNFFGNCIQSLIRLQSHFCDLMYHVPFYNTYKCR